MKRPPATRAVDASDIAPRPPGHGGALRTVLPRRGFLKATAAMAVAGLEASQAVAAPKPAGPGLVDVNVHLGRWPFRRLGADDPAALAALLRNHGVNQAWAGSFEALLHKDLGSANARLAADCRRHGRGLFIPMGSVNPRAPDWEEELRRCAGPHGMPGIRLYPNYHGYGLDHAEFARLLGRAAELGLIVQLAVAMEDERMMHPLARVEPADTAPLVEVVPRVPGLRLVLLNALGKLRAQPLLRTIAAGNVSVEISALEGVAGIENLLGQVPLERVLFGSQAPMFYFEAAALKLKESILSKARLEAIQSANARRLLPATRA